MISKRDLNFKLKFRYGVVVVTKLDPSPPFISCSHPSICPTLALFSHSRLVLPK